MIEFEIAEFFAAVLTGFAVLAGLVKAWDGIHERRAARAARRHAIRCRICGAAYRREGTGRMRPCPHCGSANRVGRDRRLG
ncbi:MAG: hypothetical protein GWO24_14945 [Akkermansiaceae bacterium]|nr:hypothetical protein [Akkermansiaceae bacterium]